MKVLGRWVRVAFILHGCGRNWYDSITIAWKAKRGDY